MKWIVWFSLISIILFSHRATLQDNVCRSLMTNTAPSSAEITILEPSDDQMIFGTEITVTVDMPDGDPTIDHWHLWANGQLQLMVYGDAATIELEPGTHQICAILGSTEHFDVGIPDSITLTMISAGAGTPTTAPSDYARERAAASTVTPEGDETGTLILAVAAAALAAVGGWLLGKRLPKPKA